MCQIKLLSKTRTDKDRYNYHSFVSRPARDIKPFIFDQKWAPELKWLNLVVVTLRNLYMFYATYRVWLGFGEAYRMAWISIKRGIDVLHCEVVNKNTTTAVVRHPRTGKLMLRRLLQHRGYNLVP